MPRFSRNPHSTHIVAIGAAIRTPCRKLLMKRSVSSNTGDRNQRNIREANTSIALQSCLSARRPTSQVNSCSRNQRIICSMAAIVSPVALGRKAKLGHYRKERTATLPPQPARF
jgi:hypothetical protein